MERTPTRSIRRKILKSRGITTEKHTGKPLTYDDLPSIYPKTQLMKYVELKFGDKLENLIFTDTIYALEKKLRVDATTISKWRKIISEAKEKEFWQPFGGQPGAK